MSNVALAELIYFDDTIATAAHSLLDHLDPRVRFATAIRVANRCLFVWHDECQNDLLFTAGSDIDRKRISELCNYDAGSSVSEFRLLNFESRNLVAIGLRESFFDTLLYFCHLGQSKRLS
jgi:hypothetical protein